MRILGLLIGFSITILGTAAQAGSVFLTGHDPDFHATRGPDPTGAINLNNVAVDYILDTAHNDIAAGGEMTLLFVESTLALTSSSHSQGIDGMIASGITDIEKHGAATLDAELDLLGTKYAGIVVASDFGGNLRQAELDILNAHSTEILHFLNVQNGGLFAMAQGNGGNGLTPDGGHFGFLPFVVSSFGANQTESGNTVTAFGASIGLTNDDINGNFSHALFETTGGLNVVDYDSNDNILSLAGRGIFDPNSGLNEIPLPLPAALMGTSFVIFGIATTTPESLAAIASGNHDFDFSNGRHTLVWRPFFS